MNEQNCMSCFWWECTACNGSFETCKYYLPWEDKTAQFLQKIYQIDIDEALAPVHDKWKNIFEKLD